MRPVTEYSFYLFDADGTLFDTTEMIVRCFLHTAAVHRLPVPSRAAIIGGTGMPLRTQMESYFGPLTDERFTAYGGTHMAYQNEIYKDYLKLCPGVGEALPRLRDAGKRAAVVTSRRLPSLSLYLAETGIAGYFDALVTPEATARHKPEPEPALEALRRLNGQAREALFVGDSPFDMECGRAAGCATAFVSWSDTDAAALKHAPDFTIGDMTELCR
ncbi:MAG: HAD-IA family hydrolase [Spirochaetales bacterium]|nr:HAD-IA family hydrolase [Spirochaetales bacterium]